MSNRFNRAPRKIRYVEEYKPVFHAYRLPLDSSVKLVRVFVEGYEDVAFWRGIFDDYETPKLKFEISVPPRLDLAKGKQVLLKMIHQSDYNTLLCMDSDFDYLFGDETEQSKIINDSPYVFHTYAYATENYLCYAPSLHNVCVKATKNDVNIFDFEKFLSDYSKIIYPLFLWYACSAQSKEENVLSLIDFKSSVKLNFLDIENNGKKTLEWLNRQVRKRVDNLKSHNPKWDNKLAHFADRVAKRGVTPDNVYLFMQGHTLMDNVVIPALHAVCEHLKVMATRKIENSLKTGQALRNEISNYENSLRSVREILLDNENYKDCFLYAKLREDIEGYIANLK